MMRVGQGYDLHRLAAGRPLLLGGVRIPSERGLLGHSDGDALLHALADALLGAVGGGDLGGLHPSSDPGLQGVASSKLLAPVVDRLRAEGWRLVNLDATVVAQQPRLSPHQPAMRESLAELLGVSAEVVNVKVKSADGLGALGRGEGIAAHVVVLLQRNEEPEGGSP